MPGTANVTVTGLGTDRQRSAHPILVCTGRGPPGAKPSPRAYTTGAVPYTAIPAAQLSNALELSQLSVFVDHAPNSDLQRLAGVYFRTPTNKTDRRRPDHEYADGHKSRHRTERPAAGPAHGAGAVRPARPARITTNRAQRFANVFATAGYFGSLPATWDITLPDLSAAAGWTRRGAWWTVRRLSGMYGAGRRHPVPRRQHYRRWKYVPECQVS